MKQLIIMGLAAFTMSGCVMTDNSSKSDSSSFFANSPDNKSEAPTTITDLYQSAPEDAKIASAVKDFRLLTFKDTQAHFPGIPDYHKIEKLKEECGARFLPGSGQLSDSKYINQQQEAMYLYAQSYNQLMLEACKNHFNQIGRRGA